jgi:hypothetical protein
MKYEIDSIKKEITLLEAVTVKELIEELDTLGIACGKNVATDWVIKVKTEFITPMYPIYPTYPTFPVIPQQPTNPWWDQPYYTVSCTAKQ